MNFLGEMRVGTRSGMGSGVPKQIDNVIAHGISDPKLFKAERFFNAWWEATSIKKNRSMVSLQEN